MPVVATTDTSAAATVPENVVPPELVTVTVPTSVPTAPLADTAPVVLSVRFDAAPPKLPLTLDRLTGLAAPVPTVKVTPSTRVTGPSVTVPVPLDRMLEPATLVAVLRPSAVFAVVMFPFTTLDPTVRATPPVKTRASGPSPKRTVPEVSRPVAADTSVIAP